ncbi:MAG: acetyltransferase [Armatimonadota bacterium]
MELPAAVIWGASAQGHGIVILEALRSQGRYSVYGFLDDSAEKQGSSVDGIPVLGGRALLNDLQSRGVNCLFLGVGDNAARVQMWRAAVQAGLETPPLVHPAAYVSCNARIGQGTFIAAGAVIGSAAEIGECCIVNTGATVDHNCLLQTGANLCPGVHLAGRVRVGEGAFVGTGAAVIPDVTIGAWAIVGAGACVIRDVAPGAKVAGVPARGLG